MSDPAQQIADLQEQLAAARAELASARVLIEQYKAQLALLRRMQFGHSSERLTAAIEQLELKLEDLEEAEAARQAQTASAKAKPEPQEQRAHGRKPLPSHLPREEVVHAPAAICPVCGGSHFARLGEDITEVLEKIPARLKVIRHIRPKFSCRSCETIVQASCPALPIEKGRPGPGLIAHVVVAKYADGLPLYRQSAMLEREGIEIERATLADWVGHAAWWLAPLAERIGAHVMAGNVIHTDDTPIAVLAPGNGKTRTGRIWTYLVDERPWLGSRVPAAYYRFSPDRKGERPRDHLAGFSGIIQADAFSGYEALARACAQARSNQPRIRHAACWSHARRKLFDEYERTGSPIAKEALHHIGELYAIESEITGQNAAMRLQVRQQRAGPLLLELKQWLTEQRRKLSPKNNLGKAIQYALTRWEALSLYVEDGRVGIDNNPAERALRNIAVTRKNFLFLGSEPAGERAAVIYTVIETAKLNGINPEEYLADIIRRMAAGHRINQIDELLPWNWLGSNNRRAA